MSNGVASDYHSYQTGAKSLVLYNIYTSYIRDIEVRMANYETKFID